jgi:hypothetical protein
MMRRRRVRHKNSDFDFPSESPAVTWTNLVRRASEDGFGSMGFSAIKNARTIHDNVRNTNRLVNRSVFTIRIAGLGEGRRRATLCHLARDRK